MAQLTREMMSEITAETAQEIREDYYKAVEGIHALQTSLLAANEESENSEFAKMASKIEDLILEFEKATRGFGKVL